MAKRRVGSCNSGHHFVMAMQLDQACMQPCLAHECQCVLLLCCRDASRVFRRCLPWLSEAEQAYVQALVEGLLPNHNALTFQARLCGEGSSYECPRIVLEWWDIRCLLIDVYVCGVCLAIQTCGRIHIPAVICQFQWLIFEGLYIDLRGLRYGIEWPVLTVNQRQAFIKFPR